MQRPSPLLCAVVLSCRANAGGSERTAGEQVPADDEQLAAPAEHPDHDVMTFAHGDPWNAHGH